MNWRARLLLLDGLIPAVDEDGGLVWGTLADAPQDAELVFLGLIEGKACFAPVPRFDPAASAFDPRSWQILQMLTPSDLATYGCARSLVDWHSRHRFCARCGQGTVPAKGGWQRTCDICGAEHFPRTDPVTIMLVEHGDSLLLGRQPRFPPRIYSALAGFVEPGETIEEAVAREVYEEAGVRVTEVSYIASQPLAVSLAIDDRLPFGGGGHRTDDRQDRTGRCALVQQGGARGGPSGRIRRNRNADLPASVRGGAYARNMVA